MALPGSHRILQFARAEEADLANWVGEEGEMVIDLTNQRVRLSDGVTVGGIIFYNADDIAELVGGDAIPAGTISLAQTGSDTVQRTWPAAVFALFAQSAAANLTGTPTADTPPSNSDGRRIATTEWVVDNFAPFPTPPNNIDGTSFSIGYPLWAQRNGANVARNTIPSQVMRLDPSNSNQFILGGVGSVLAGTWRCAGTDETLAGNVLMVRTQ